MTRVLRSNRVRRCRLCGYPLIAGRCRGCTPEVRPFADLRCGPDDPDETELIFLLHELGKTPELIGKLLGLHKNTVLTRMWRHGAWWSARSKEKRP